ncbi:amidohydrolase family protein [Nonomuraea sediminis]|uniref:amidohydrolase family protein n=1 Tax=Nonomuraea sediminis TaxID=2835864 RepID=UPI001BDCF2B2|nr:amidohydrolase family protein [Nonomuraea sediminis]
MTIRVFRNAVIHTGDDTKPLASALAVDGGTLVAVGGEAEVRAAVGGQAELVDLDGVAVLPGLYDAHIHTASFARGLSEVDLRGARSLEEALARIAEHAVRLPPGAWLFGGRWNSNTWDRPVQPDRHSLDGVCPARGSGSSRSRRVTCAVCPATWAR